MPRSTISIPAKTPSSHAQHQVTVSIKKIGYDLSDKANTTKPLAGAVIGVYSDEA